MRRLLPALFLAALAARPAAAQLGQLVSPGPLTKAHAALEGLEKCGKCHEKGKRVAAERCLACHQPVKERMAAGRGVHRIVKGDCVSCHVEHNGRDAELRPFDAARFDHAKETGFALAGLHAAVAKDCTKCHRTRSFLAASPTCGSCHRDVHKGVLGADCASCHAVAVAFKDTRKRFDHARAAFRLEGAHVPVDCAKCHRGGVFRGVKFDTCESCHRDPHRRSLGASCAECHSAASWKVPRFDHARTGTALAGRHADVACAKCHVKPAALVKLKMNPCAACHADVHRGLFKQDCASCHRESGFSGAPFEHAAKTRFALTGRHAELRCAACHKAASPARTMPASTRVVDFRGLKTPCASCHADVHRGQLGASCESCHGTTTFRVREFRHPRQPELFAGRHAGLACEACHKGGATTGGKGGSGTATVPAAVPARTFRGLPTDCASCHKDPHLGQLGARCESCHSVDVPAGAPRFAATRFRHETTRFALTEKHAGLDCAKCHRRETAAFPAGSGTAVRLAGLSTECRACHTDVHLGQLGGKCESCHTTRTFAVATFAHKDAAFFRGRHATAECRACHKPVEASFPARRGRAVRFKGLGGCASCHADPHKGTLGANCASCHAVNTAFRSASRAFHKSGTFPLDGRHLAVPCASCHLNAVTKGTPTACYDCHWVRRQDDPNRTRLGADCAQCHRTTAWAAVTFDHGARTGVPLGGAHATLACERCHAGRVFGRAGNGAAGAADCVACHRAAFDATRQPNHAAAGFPTACATCHRASDVSWRGAGFSHARYPLVGVHATQPCAACHRNGVYAGTASDCASCHGADYDRSANPSHMLAGFARRCESCHQGADASWRQGRYQHLVWPLAGTHAAQGCASCHRTGLFKGTSSDCASCHRPDFDRAANPNHAAAGFPLACAGCHKVSDLTWHQGTFDHASVFPLAGVHAVQACAVCHKSGVFKGTPRDCVSCHQADYDRSANPNHLLAGFQTRCDSCHAFSDPTWKQGRYSHVSWPLQGQHLAQDCATCHRTGVFKGTPRDCASCHRADYDRSANPNHATAGFPLTCETCHKVSDASWKQGTFAHAASFPLVGVHATQACAACHRNGVYTGTPRDCVGCHRADYDRSASPNHATAGFPVTCETCHKQSDATWHQGVFNHASAFPLVGVHATQPCAVCHKNGVYAGTPRTCVGCHLTKYQQTTNPNHAAAGFPTTCETCHRATDASWSQGTFTHSTFALVGVHASQPCAACHKNGVYAGTPRTCVGCHLPDYQRTTNPNHAAAGFPTTCETCHRATDASWHQGTFNHTWFPITSGRHAGNPCSACHTSPSNYAVFTCLTCHDRARTDAKHQGRPGYRYDSQACYACHPQGRGD